MSTQKSIMNVTIQTLVEISKICDKNLIDVVMSDFLRSGGLLKWHVPQNQTDLGGDNVDENLLVWDLGNYVSKDSFSSKYKFMLVFAYMLCGGSVILENQHFGLPAIFNEYIASKGLLSIEDCHQITKALLSYQKEPKEIFPEIKENSQPILSQIDMVTKNNKPQPLNEMARFRKTTTGLPMVVCLNPDDGNSAAPRLRFQDNTSSHINQGALVPISIDPKEPRILLPNYKINFPSEDIAKLIPSISSKYPFYNRLQGIFPSIASNRK